MQTENLIGLIGGIMGIISVPMLILISWFQTKYQYRQYFMELIDKVNDRYDRLHPLLNSLPQNYPQCSSEQKLAISRYINLCSEEYLWWILGMVHPRVWQIWQAGIREKFQVPVINEAWTNHHTQEYDSEFQDFISTRILHNPPGLARLPLTR